ncbi:MAG: response regulator [Lachnospiraceae bacterium]|nr:response regulator [Lachnospiraceae bacterium]
MKVFLADDEIVVREGIRESFPWDETPYTLVGEAPDGEMALPIIRDTNPDIVITDIRMPFMDGIELCRTLRAQMPWIGIIVLSGYDEFEYARQCLQLGVREYLVKPINSENLREALDKVSKQLEDERKAIEHAASLRNRLGNDEHLVREKLIASLYSEDAASEDAANVLKHLESMGCNVTAPYYAVVDAAFDPVSEGQAVAYTLSESSGGVMHATPTRTGSALLVLGDTAEDAEERAYAFASSLVQEAERTGCKDIRVGIGEIVDAPEDILKSFKAARHIRHILVDRAEEKSVILGTREMGDVSGDANTPAMISEAKLYMSQHFTDPNLMLQDVAKAVGMSNSRFSTVFSQTGGQTFTEYLIYLRLNKAKEMLRTTAVKSSQIARESGYNDSHYFSYIFKKNVGMTPSEYRSQYRNVPE